VRLVYKSTVLSANVLHSPQQAVRGAGRGEPLLTACWAPVEGKDIIGDVCDTKGAIACRRELFRDPFFDDARPLLLMMITLTRFGHRG
jgi:hypothetical protein